MRETRIKGSEAPVGESLRVLLVEDSENDALLLVRELRRGGYKPLCERVYTPEDMERALREAETRGEPFQVVISDYYMPRFGAPEALELLRELGHDVPFIVVSGKIGEDAAVGVMKAGADDYLTKENMSRLCPAIERELREAEVRREREKAERALGRSEDRFRRLVEQAADAIFVHDLDGRIVDVNRQACDSLGYSREELLSMSVQDFEANFVPGSFRRLWEQITSGPPRTLDGIHRRKDGTTFPVEVRVGVFEAEEHPLMLALVRDVSERREAEKKIRETEARYRTLVEQIPAVTYVQEPIESDNPKAVTYMSPQYEAMLGYPPEKEILDEEHWLKVLHPDDRERVLAEELRTDETGEPYRIEYRQIARGGRVVWVRDEATLVRDEDGNPLYWLGVQYDITEQKRIEEDLRSSEERFRVTFEQAAVGIVQVGLDGEWLRYNDKLCDILGYTREELETVSVFDLISPEDVEKDYDRGVSMLAGEISNYTEEKLIVGKDGRRVWITLTVSLVHDGSDDPRYFIAVLEDIGKRKQAEKDFRLRDRAIAASSNGIVITDPNLPDNPIVYVNPAFERITGYPVDEVLGQNCRFLQGEGDRDQPALDELREAIKEGRYSSVILRNRRKDGTPFWNELSVSPVRDEEGKLTHFVGVQNDVTGRQRTQEELRQSEERFKVLAQEVVEGILLIENGRIIDANRSVTEMFGYELEELIGKEAIELTLPENREMVRRRIADEDTTVYESEGLKKDGTAFPIEIRPRHLPYSGRRIRVTSVIDLTERRRAEDAVRESEKRFRALVQNASDIILVLDAEGIIRYESPAVERVLGYSPEERVGINAFERIHPDDRARVVQVFSENLSRPGPFPPVEYRVRHKDGAWRHLEAIGENLLHDPVIRGVVVNSRDVTERKRAEQTLKKSERRFRHLFENSSDALFIHDERGRFVDCNAEACRALGYTREELLSLSVADVATRLISEEERREGETLWERALRGEPGRIVGLDDNEMRRKDGTTFPVEVGVGSIEYGERRMIFASARDITGRKRAEEALRQSEARLQAILDNTTAVVYIKDEEGRYSLINQRFKELFHVTRDEVLGKTDHDIFPEEVADEFRTNDEEVLRSGVPLEVEEVVPQDDGIHTYVSVKVPLNSPDGTPYAICGISTDITERKRAEEALLMSEERYRAVVEQSAEGIYLLDAATKRLIESNPALQMMLGYSSNELKGMHIYDIAAHSQDDLDENVRVTLSKRARYVGERRYRRKDGKVVEVEVGVSVISYSGMDVICAVLRDITERKRAEARYRTLVEQLPAVTYMQELENSTLAYVSPQIEDVLGYSPEEYLENPNLRSQTIHPEDRGWVLEEDARTDETGEPYSVEYRRIARDGRVLWVREEAVLVRDSEGRPLFWQGILMDVTERKHQEEALRQSEALYRTVVEQASENIFLVDAKSRRVLEANAALHRSLGYTAEELKEMTLYDIVAHEQESVDINIERIMEEGHRSLGERQYRRKDGSLADVEVNVSAVPYDGRKVMCIVAHDVTERKQAERALQEIREAERNRIARELHDSTLQDIVYALQEIQVMQVVAGDVNPALEDTADALRRSVEGLRGAIFELRVRETLNLSLVSSLESLVDLNRRMARGRYGLELIVDDDFPARLREGAGQELTRLVQEALTNVRRHAEAAHVRVELGLDGDLAFVEVSDDGRGFDSEKARTGIGQQSMSQRAAELGGELSVQSAPGEGTRVRFLIPVSRLVEG